MGWVTGKLACKAHDTILAHFCACGNFIMSLPFVAQIKFVKNFVSDINGLYAMKQF